MLQDFTGVPCIVDLAAICAMVAIRRSKINPLQPVEIVIDHSVQIDYFGFDRSQERPARFERNGERYAFRNGLG